MEPHYLTTQYQFYFAAEDGNLARLQELIDTGEVNLNDCDDYGDNPLSLAIEYHKNDVLELLLASGANPNQHNVNDGQPPILRAILHDNMDALEILLKSGADINGRDKKHQYTALMWATTCGIEDFVEYLLKAGASCTARNIDGETADMIAQKSDNKSLSAIFDRHKNAKFRNLKGYLRKQRFKR